MSKIKLHSDRHAGGLWAITSYFNPMAYRRRLLNYRLFRQNLNVPLVTIELAYGHEFELRETDADILVQLRGKDILWQKERLLNLALQALPSRCRKVAWIDCDVVFEADDWPELTSALLDRFMLVQPFSHAYHVPPNWEPGGEPLPGLELRRSVPFLVASGLPVAICMGESFERYKPAPGFVWATTREFLDEHRLYDTCIVGGGDGVITRAAYGCFADAIAFQQMNERRRQHYLPWANRFYDVVRANVTFLKGNLFHLWHGRTEYRRYAERFEGLLEFDPCEDLALDHNGTWRWNSDKREMHEYVRGYFRSRREDG